MSNLNKLNSIWKSLNEETDVPRETSKETDQSTKKEEVSVDIVAVATNETTKKTSSYGKTPDFILFKDTNSKEVSPVDREMGSKQAIKDFVPSNTKLEMTNPVDREMGSKQAVKDFKVTNTAMDTVEPVPREMGVQEAPKDYLKEYKSNISKVLESIKESIKI